VVHDDEVARIDRPRGAPCQQVPSQALAPASWSSMTAVALFISGSLHACVDHFAIAVTAQTLPMFCNRIGRSGSRARPSADDEQTR